MATLSGAAYINAATIALPLFIPQEAVSDGTSCWGIRLFAALSALLHITPTERAWVNQLPKILLSPLLFDEPRAKLAVTAMTCLGAVLPPLEPIGGVARQLKIASRMAEACVEASTWKAAAVALMLACKAAYAHERRRRLRSGKRRDFGLLHCSEHIDVTLYLLLFAVTDAERSRAAFAVLLALPVLLVLPAVALFLLQRGLLATRHWRPLPAWLPVELVPLFREKELRNLSSHKLWNSAKLYMDILGWKRVTWADLEQKVASIALPERYSPDLLVGVASGGAFILPLVASKQPCARAKKLYVAHSGGWSNKSLLQTARMGIAFLRDVHAMHALPHKISVIEPASDSSAVAMCSPQPVPQRQPSAGVTRRRARSPARKGQAVGAGPASQTQAATILLVDDSISTGSTIARVSDWLKQRFPGCDLRVLTLYSGKLSPVHVDYRPPDALPGVAIPLWWPWGLELD